MSKSVRGVLLDVNTGSMQGTTLDGSLQGFYEALDCACIDIVDRTINGRPYTIVCDDEGLLKDGAKLSAISEDNDPMLVGNLFITNSEYTPDGAALADLADDDISHIKGAARQYLDARDDEELYLRTLLTCVSYWPT